MRKRTRLTLLAGVVMLAGFMVFMCMGLSAAEDVDVTVSANVASTIQLNMPTTAVDFGGGELTPGTAYPGVITAVISSNRSYGLTVTKGGDLTGPSETIPSSALTFGATMPVGGTYAAPDGTQFGTGIDVVTGARGGNRSTTITYSLTVPWEQNPETYTATHTYTAAQI